MQVPVPCEANGNRPLSNINIPYVVLKGRKRPDALVKAVEDDLQSEVSRLDDISSEVRYLRESV
jgi:hypothetical protein